MFLNLKKFVFKFFSHSNKIISKNIPMVLKSSVMEEKVT